jgi:short-subunit dehydrogenase
MTNWLDGKTVVITGASSGIGAALAKTCSRRGARVALAARRRQRLTEVAALCESETLAIPCDVTKDDDRRRLVESTLDQWGQIDVLINNAGLGLYAPFDEIEESDLRELMDVNLVAVFRMTQAILPAMRKARFGRIVNIASTGGLIAHAPNVSAYLAAKHAVVGMSRGLRLELEASGISVQVVCPHLTDTEFFRVGVGADVMSNAADRLRRHMDSADDVAEGIVDQIGADPFIVFPTDRSKTAYERFVEV